MDIPLGNLPCQGPREGCVSRHSGELDMELHSRIRRSSSSVVHQLEDVHGTYLET